MTGISLFLFGNLQFAFESNIFKELLKFSQMGYKILRRFCTKAFNSCNFSKPDANSSPCTPSERSQDKKDEGAEGKAAIDEAIVVDEAVSEEAAVVDEAVEAKEGSD